MELLLQSTYGNTAQLVQNGFLWVVALRSDGLRGLALARACDVAVCARTFCDARLASAYEHRHAVAHSDGGRDGGRDGYRNGLTHAYRHRDAVARPAS